MGSWDEWYLVVFVEREVELLYLVVVKIFMLKGKNYV